MQKIPRPLLVLHGDAPFRDQMSRVAEQSGYELRPLTDWEHLSRQLSSAPASALLVVDPYLGVSGEGEPAPGKAAAGEAERRRLMAMKMRRISIMFCL